MSDRPNPVDPSLEERVARAIYASWFAVTIRDTDIPDRLPDGFVPVAQRVVAALTTEDYLALLQAQSDGLVVTLSKEEMDILLEAAGDVGWPELDVVFEKLVAARDKIDRKAA